MINLIIYLREMAVDGLAGGIAALISNLLFYPLENIRARLQNYSSEQNQKEKGKDNIRKEFSALRFCYDVWKHEGLKAFYSGLGITCWGSVVTFAIYFFWYKFWKLALAPYPQTLDSSKIIVITALAALITNALTSPIWRIQTIMCVTKEKKSVYQHVRDSINEDGLTGLWKGFLTGQILVLNPVINFAIYEKLRFLCITEDSQVLCMRIIFLISLIAKLTATLFTYPLLTLKTKEFTNKGKGSTLQVLGHFLKEEGVFALYRGIYAKILQTVLNNALMMVTFEAIKDCIERTLM
ncbi:unnamed protein product [Moneuplotes crassus]|uniref:Uncharacterized protein n=1 Tax=Euplotes crassus TaxID=5936 RepID=A0AAD1U3N3_EUPCR|nr:unnamed protein product [Moneuplotes crassus]